MLVGNDPSSSDAALDNLPAEVQHLLVEIKHKETKSQGTHSQPLLYIYVYPYS